MVLALKTATQANGGKKKNNGEPRSKLTHAKELRNLNEEKILSSINSTGKTGYSQEK